jgi:hypothetical protein
MPPRLPHAPLLALVLVVPIAACSGTPFGDQLSTSFSDPPAPEEPQSSQDAPQAESSKSPEAQQNKSQRNDPVAVAPSPPAEPPPTVASSSPPAEAVPYRLTLRLPAVDPAAPAEAVTKALRSAGLAFEVEKIERVPASAVHSAPMSAPAPPVVQNAPAAR